MLSETQSNRLDEPNKRHKPPGNMLTRALERFRVWSESSLGNQLEQQILHEGSFHSEKDREIALEFLSLLKERYQQKKISADTFREALSALELLVPMRNQLGRREIADITITPGLEKIISSRLSAEETQLDARDGPWGRLPKEIRRVILEDQVLLLELTDRCTVQCSFCAYSDKGPISNKAGFESVLRVVKQFVDASLYKPATDILYYMTDPFDAKWLTEDGVELDYLDLTKRYWNIIQFCPDRSLFTSTAVPIGEEFRVLKCAHELITADAKKVHQSDMRLFETSKNIQRVSAIVIILGALCGDLPTMSRVTVGSNRNDPEVTIKSGSAWKDEYNDLDAMDILGNGTEDGVLIRVHGVDGLIMQAGSEERPKACTEFPIERVIKRENESIRYFTIPVPHSAQTRNPYVARYPNARLNQYAVGPDNKIISEKTLVLDDDPHRAMLRIASHLKDERLADENGIITHRPSELQKYEFQMGREQDLQLVADHIVQSGNRAMTAFMKMLRDKGVLDAE